MEADTSLDRYIWFYGLVFVGAVLGALFELGKLTLLSFALIPIVAVAHTFRIDKQSTIRMIAFGLISALAIAASLSLFWSIEASNYFEWVPVVFTVGLPTALVYGAAEQVLP